MLLVLLCKIFVFVLIEIVTQWWLLYSYFDNLPIMSVLFTHRCKYNGIWCDCHTSERFSAIKPDSIHSFLHLKTPVPSQDSCCPFVWCVLSFDFAIWLGTFRFEFFSEFSIFVILLFFIHFWNKVYRQVVNIP